MTNYKNAEWLQEQYIENDRSQTEIADEFDVSSTTISYWCDKFDIEKTQPAQFGIQTDEYEQWKCETGPGKADTVLVHRLLATLKVDELDELEGKHVHHQSKVPWDNRLENLEVVSPQEHAEIHTRGAAVCGAGRKPGLAVRRVPERGGGGKDLRRGGSM